MGAITWLSPAQIAASIFENSWDSHKSGVISNSDWKFNYLFSTKLQQTLLVHATFTHPSHEPTQK